MALGGSRPSSALERALLAAAAVAVVLAVIWIAFLAWAPDSSRRTVFVVGDSFTGHSPLNAGPMWPQLLADRAKLHVDVDAVAYTGYLAGASKDRSFGDRLSEDVGRSSAHLVVFAGGRFDYGNSSASRIAAAAARALDRWHKAQPDAELVLFSPFCSGPPPAEARELGAAFARIAPRHHATYVDVSTLLKFDKIGQDGIHPNHAGQRVLAHGIRLALEGHHLLPSP